MAQELIAKSAKAGISVLMKEKYGDCKKYDHLTVIMLHDNKFYLVAREGTKAVLPAENWAIESMENTAPDGE